MIWLALSFFVTAVVYASVGFGGGSTYTALLVLAGVDYRILPVLSLVCNILVVSGGTARFARAGLLPWREAAVLTSVAAPAAFLGGLTPIGEGAFMAVLGVALVLAAVALFLPIRPVNLDAPRKRMARAMPFVAIPLGYLAGLVGIGGGIFLAPLLHLAQWHNPRAIAATASLFILVNSLFGLAGQLLKGGPERLVTATALGLPLMLAVVIGGQIGSLLAVRFLPWRWIRWTTALLTGWVGLRLVLESVAGAS